MIALKLDSRISDCFEKRKGLKLLFINYEISIYCDGTGLHDQIVSPEKHISIAPEGSPNKVLWEMWFLRIFLENAPQAFNIKFILMNEKKLKIFECT